MGDFNINYSGQNTNWDVTTNTEPVRTTDASGQTTVQDTITLGSTARIDFNYTHDSDSPTVLPPNPNPNNEPPPNSPPTPSLEHQYYEHFEEGFNQMIEQNNLTDDQAQQLIFAHMTGTQPSDPQLAQLLGELEGQAAAEMLAEYPELNENWKPPGVRKDFMGDIQRDFNGDFEEALQQFAQEHNLSDQEVAKLRFAHYNPDLADPSVSEYLASLEGSVLESLGETYGFSADFKPEVDNSDYMGQMIADFDSAFDAQLTEYAQQNGLSETEVNQIKYMHYHPEDAAGQNPELMGIMEELENAVLSELGSDYGLPEGFRPDPATGSYDASVNGDFQFTFMENLNNQDPPLTQAQKDAILAHMRNPDASGASQETIALFEGIYAQTIGEVISARGLPADWQPEITLAELATLNPVAKTAINTWSQTKERINLAQKIVAGMPDGPEKAMYMNVLKMISEALAELKEILHQMQMNDSSISKSMSEIQKDATIAKIRKHEKKMEKMRKKKKKMKKLQPLMDTVKVFTYTMIIVTAVLMGPGGLLMLPVMLSLAALMIHDMETGDGVFTQLFAEIDTLFTGVEPEILGETLNAATKLTISIAMGGAIMGAMIFFQQSGAISDLVVAMGASEMVGEIVNMAVEMVYEMMVMIILTIAVGVATAGIGATPMVGLMIGRIGMATVQTTSKVVQMVAKAIQTAVKAVKKIVDVIMKALQKTMQKVKTMMKALTRVAKMGDDVVDDFFDAADDAVTNLAKKLDDLDVGTKAYEQTLKQGRRLTDKISEKFAKRANDAINKADELQKAGKIKKMKYGFDKANDLLTFIMAPAQVATTVASGAQVYVSVQRMRMALEIGDFEAYMTEIEAMIKLLKKVVENLLNGLQGIGDLSVEIGNSQNNFWNKLNEASTGMHMAL